MGQLLCRRLVLGVKNEVDVVEGVNAQRDAMRRSGIVMLSAVRQGDGELAIGEVQHG